MLAQAATEQEFAKQLADEFLSEGYLLLDPTEVHRELPTGYRPDLLLRKGNDFLVVEIKSQEEHRNLEQIRLIKQFIETKPNWQFKLYVLPRSHNDPILEDNIEDMGKLISRAKQLNRNREFEAASVILWIAIEVALRTLLTQHQSRPNLGVSGMSMARSLLSFGELGEDEVRLIERGWKVRNQSVHGFRLTPREPLTPALIALADRLAERAKAEVQ